jgi:hypothetical protein
VQQNAAAIGGEVGIGEAVIVVVADRAAEEVTGEFVQSGLGGHIGETALAVAFVESEIGADEENVEGTVLVIIQEGAAIAYTL